MKPESAKNGKFRIKIFFATHDLYNEKILVTLISPFATLEKEIHLLKCQFLHM